MKSQLEIAEHQCEQKLAAMKRQLDLHVQQKAKSLQKVEFLQTQLRINESNKEGDRAVEIWKGRFEEMMKISQKLMVDNKNLQLQIKELNPSNLPLYNQPIQSKVQQRNLAFNKNSNVGATFGKRGGSVADHGNMSLTTNSTHSMKSVKIKSTFDTGNLFMKMPSPQQQKPYDDRYAYNPQHHQDDALPLISRGGSL